MAKLLRRILLVCFFGINNLFIFAQTSSDKPEMADLMRSNGKIYAVVAVCLTILIGLIIYVFFIDRKISRLEKGKN